MRVNPVDPIYRIYKENTGLIGRCLRGIKVPEYCEFEDLEQAGRIGLLKAAENYKPEKGIKFCTYAYSYIRGFILREIYKNISILSHKGLEKLATKKILKLPTMKSLSINEEEGDYNPSLQIIDTRSTNDIDIVLDYYKLKTLYDKLFKCLLPRQKQALELYYFTINEKGKHPSYREVAEIMGVSQERVRQLLDKGKHALKARFGKYLDVYV